MPKDMYPPPDMSRQQVWLTLLRWAAQILGLACVWFVLLKLASVAFSWLWSMLAIFRPGGMPFSLADALIGFYIVGLYLMLWIGISRIAQKQRLTLSRLQGSPLVMGFGSALLLLGLHYLYFARLGWLELATPVNHWPWVLLQSLLLGLGVAWLEEHLFRDLLFKWLGRAYTIPEALCFQALLFSLAHQLRGNWPLEQRLLSLFGLFGVGLFLGQIYCRYRWSWAVGLHAGWVTYCSFGAQAQLWIWKPDSQLWHGAGNPIESVTGLLLFAGLNGVFWRYGPALKSETETGLCSDVLQKPVS